jgi:hypothetical protein
VPIPPVIDVRNATDWTAIAGILSTAVVGLAGVLVTGLRFGHERRMKASDDLVALLDGVDVGLEELGGACAELSQYALAYGGEPQLVAPRLQVADDAYQKARALIERLGMRPHADARLVERARASADSMLDGIRLVRRAVIAHPLGHPYSTEAQAALGGLPARINQGYESKRAYEILGREAIGRLLGHPAGERRGIRRRLHDEMGSEFRGIFG